MINGLYFITPSGSEQQVLAATRAALRGGARVVQYRDKERGCSQDEASTSRV